MVNIKQLEVSERIPLPARKLQNLVQQLMRVSRSQAQQLIQQGAAQVNGRTLRVAHTTLSVGDRLEVFLAPAAEPRVQAAPAKSELRVQFEDDHLLVVEKPPELLTVPTPYRERVTLISLLEKRAGSPPGEPGVFCVHRLDRGVSGLLVFGKRLEIAKALRDQFEQRKPKRRYLALVAGKLAKGQGTFQSHLMTDRNLHRRSTDVPGQGELAITHYRAVQDFARATLVEVWLETGRRNQIRVHFAEAGHPVLGDPRYGGRIARPPEWPFKRLALHAVVLGFRHPVTRRELLFESPLPREMRDFGK